MSIWCYRRKTYATERAALAVIYRLRAHGNEVAVYQCETCRKWHIKALPLIGRGQAA